MTEASGGLVLPQGADAGEVKARTAELRAQAARQLADVEAKKAALVRQLEEQKRELEAEFARQRAALEAQLKPLQDQVAKLVEVAWTVDLYLGRDETLTQLRAGRPAPVETPITVRQRVLVMAEEALVLMENGGTGVDASSIEVFVDWLLTDPAHLDRVLPESKGVVVMVPTRVEVRSGNVYEDAYRNAANRQSYWLFRNGEQVWLLTVDGDLDVGERLYPQRDEFTAVFEPRLFATGEKQRLEPGSRAWLVAEKAADARRRHFMRIVMVLQGVADRTTVWQPLLPSINFFDIAAQDDGKIRIIQDAETAIQLGDGREPFADWQRRLNALLRPGLRVIGDWAARGFRDEYEKGTTWSRGGHPRVSPPNAPYPPANEPLMIEGRRAGGLVVRYERTDTIWKRNVPIPGRPGWVYREQEVIPERRASCVVMPTDGWVLPYDLVTVPELEAYLASREERSKHFLSMVPTVRAALAAKRAEAEAEAPFRVLVRDQLVNAGADLSDADRLVDELVHWWKVANTWARPLNGDPAHEGKALAQIVAEHKSRQGRGAVSEQVQRMVAAGQRVDGAICVAHNRAGRWFAYSPSLPAHDEGVWLDVTPIRADGTLGEADRWKRLQPRSVSLLNVAWSTSVWDDWTFAANPNHYLTGPEREQMIADVRTSIPDGCVPVCLTERFKPADPGTRTVTAYWWKANRRPSTDAPYATNDPYGAYTAADRQLVESATWQVTKRGRNVSVVRMHRQREPFGRYTPNHRLGGIPWWPEDAYRYADPRHRLVWSDEAAIDEMVTYRDACKTLLQEAQEARKERDTLIYQYVDAVSALIGAERDKALRERFDEDYGPAAADLWPSHKESLRLPEQPVHPRTLWGLIAIAWETGEQFEGRTLAELDTVAAKSQYRAPGEWHTTARDTAKWLPTYGHIVVPSAADLPPKGGIPPVA